MPFSYSLTAMKQIITMTSWGTRWRLKSPAPRLFTRPFIQGADHTINVILSYQRKHQSSASLAFVRWIHRWPVNSPHKGPVTRKMFPFDDVIMCCWWNTLNENSGGLYCRVKLFTEDHCRGKRFGIANTYIQYRWFKCLSRNPFQVRKIDSLCGDVIFTF